MGCENEVKTVLLQIALQVSGKQAVHLKNRRGNGQSAVMLAEGVGKAEQTGRILYQTDIAVAHQSSGFSARQREGVKKYSPMAAPFQFIRHRPRGGMMAAACSTGKNQCFHIAFTSHFSRSSEPERSFAATAAVMIQKPAQTGVPGRNRVRRTAAVR